MFVGVSCHLPAGYTSPCPAGHPVGRLGACHVGRLGLCSSGGFSGWFPYLTAERWNCRCVASPVRVPTSQFADEPVSRLSWQPASCPGFPLSRLFAGVLAWRPSGMWTGVTAAWLASRYAGGAARWTAHRACSLPSAGCAGCSAPLRGGGPPRWLAILETARTVR